MRQDPIRGKFVRGILHRAEAEPCQPVILPCFFALLYARLPLGVVRVVMVLMSGEYGLRSVNNSCL